MTQDTLQEQQEEKQSFQSIVPGRLVIQYSGGIDHLTSPQTYMCKVKQLLLQGIT